MIGKSGQSGPVRDGGNRAPRRRTSCPIGKTLESLEGRALLSHVGVGPVAAPVPTVLVQAQPHHRVSIEIAPASGMAQKKPHFYEFFNGTQRADLNLVAASARVVQSNLLLTGTMQGRINQKTLGDTEHLIYVFGINRGSSQAVTPFFQRDKITFDAVVVVQVDKSKISGFVRDLTNGTQTDLATNSIHILGRMVRVTVGTAQLPTPTGGVPLKQYTFNLWPRTNLGSPPADPTHPHASFVASFIPENGMAPIRVPRVTGGGNTNGGPY